MLWMMDGLERNIHDSPTMPTPFSASSCKWGTSYFFPAIAMASHISAVPNHAVFRTTSLKLRCDVAISGRLGMEIQPKNMTDEEKAFCRQVISEYKGAPRNPVW